ncbi:hypothetical protein [Novosphingobium rosa]|uniref:hypothetical protein n=1 Tax=Novosphingobium rosa TaxID=76978 RepID=UPI00083340C4|nr:hypothetical protein [Novosphingobium rosa]
MGDALELVKATPRHVGRIASQMRAIDRAECAAMGRTPKEALRLGLMTSDRAVTALVHGQPAAMFGVVVQAALTGEGLAWMLGTDEVYAHGRQLLTKGPGLIAGLGDSCRRLSNLISAGNGKAIRLLKRWGFTVDDDVMMVGGMAFLHFHMELR